MKNSCLIATCLALALPALSMSMDAEAAGKGQRGPRGELVHQIVMKWGSHVQEAYRANAGEWASDMVPVFAKANLDTLRRAANAPTFDSMNDAFLANGERSAIAQNWLMSKSGEVGTRELGDTTKDLVFVPVNPCRILDTRLAGGVIAANTVRSFDVNAVTDYSFQGGAASDCGGVGAAGSFAAAAINFTVVTPGAAGYITAFPFLGTQPVAATVNYAAGSIVGNYAVVKLDQGASASELSVYSFAQTHLVADIVGYYTTAVAPASAPLALECNEVVSTTVTIGANATNNVFSPACAAGYTKVAVQCRPSSFDLRLAGSWTDHCNYFNAGAASTTATAAAKCCRMPAHPAF